MGRGGWEEDGVWEEEDDEAGFVDFRGLVPLVAETDFMMGT